jgi:hypothetical protein
MPFRYKQEFPREEKCLLDLLWSVLHMFVWSLGLKSLNEPTRNGTQKFRLSDLILMVNAIAIGITK